MRLKRQSERNSLWNRHLGLGQWGGTKLSVDVLMSGPGNCRAGHNLDGTTLAVRRTRYGLGPSWHCQQETPLPPPRRSAPWHSRHDAASSRSASWPCASGSAQPNGWIA